MRCTNLAASVVGLLLVIAARPGATADPWGLAAIRDRAKALQDGAAASAPPAWLRPAAPSPAASAAATLGQDERARYRRSPPAAAACADLGLPCAASPPPSAAATDPAGAIGYTVFVSRSLGAEALRAIFRTARGADVRIVLRGVNPGERLMDAIRAVQALLNDLDPPPNVEIDPTPFRDADVRMVPVTLATGPAGELARVGGLTAPDWLRAQLRAGARGDLGVRGPVVAIGEPDLIAELQRRAAALDLDALRTAAIGRYWQRATFASLPAATAARERTVDPTVTAGADLLLPDGTALIRAGETLNPLDRLPFTHRLVVFDAADPRQVATARRLGQGAGPLRPLYLASNLDRAQGWDGLHAVQERLDAPVYLLTPEVRTRFALERVPALVEPRGRVFVVSEVPVDALAQGPQ